jgi:hypothetical protein
MNSLYDIEQIYFSNLQSIFYKMLNNIKHTKNKNIDKNTIIKLLELNKTISNIELLINDINIDLIKSKKSNKSNIDLEETNKKYNNIITDYKKDDIVLKKFIPYVLLYRMYLDLDKETQ